MRVFIDTSALYALLDRTDENHLKAKREWNRILDEDYTLVASNYILVRRSWPSAEPHRDGSGTRISGRRVSVLLHSSSSPPRSIVWDTVEPCFLHPEGALVSWIGEFRGYAGNRDPKGVSPLILILRSKGLRWCLNGFWIFEKKDHP